MTFPTGKRFITIFGSGAGTAHGSGYISAWWSGYESWTGRQATQGAASLDSQSVKTATPASMEVGYDGGKKVKGGKRHLMVDTLGLLLMVVVTAAHISDPQGARLLFARLAKVPQCTRRLLHIMLSLKVCSSLGQTLNYRVDWHLLKLAQLARL